MHQSPLISVIMACYNGEHWLESAIHSVQQQSIANFELLIIDDGSTDSSPDIISASANKDPRISVVTKKNTGLADSLNVGIQRARAPWIARLDCDDLCEPRRLEVQLRAATAQPGIVFVGSDSVEIDENGHVQRQYSYPRNHAALVHNLLTSKRFPAHSSAFFSTTVVRELAGYRVRMKRAQDRDLWLRLSSRGKLTVVDEALVRVRKHQSQISHTDGGRLQKVFSRAAIASHILRNSGEKDPIDQDDLVFSSFIEHITRTLEATETFTYYTKLEALKHALSGLSAPRKLTALLRACAYDPKFALQIAEMQTLGSRINTKLASKWLEQARPAPEAPAD